MKPLIENKSYARYERRVLKKIGRHHFKYQNVLDLGCGWGFNTSLIATLSKRTIGVDVKERPSWKEFSSKKLKFQVSDATNKLPFDDSIFDVSYMRNLLHHVDNPDQILKEAQRVTKPRGKIIIAEANRYSPFFYIYTTKMRKHEHFSRRFFVNLIKNRFVDFQMKYFEALYFPTDSEIVHKLERLWEEFVESIPILKSIRSYNVAIIKNLK